MTGALAVPGVFQWVKWVLLFNSLLPISLYVSLELCKLVQASLIIQVVTFTGPLSISVFFRDLLVILFSIFSTSFRTIAFEPSLIGTH